MIIFYAFLRITALLQTPRADPERIMIEIMNGPRNTGSTLGMNTAYALADCSQD